MTRFLTHSIKNIQSSLLCAPPTARRVGATVLSFLLSAMAASSLAVASEWGEWEDARILYDSGQYQGALELLMAKPDLDSPIFHFNIGSIYFRMEKFGQAAAHLEKARSMNPADADIQHNLDLARDALSAKTGIRDLDPGANWVELFVDGVSIVHLKGTLSLLVLVALLLWTQRYRTFRKSTTPTSALRATMSSAPGFAGWTAILALLAVIATESLGRISPPGVLVSDQIIRSGPGARFLDLTTIHAGVRVRLTGRVTHASNSGKSESGNSELWRQVRYGDDAVGWLPSSSLLLL